MSARVFKPISLNEMPRMMTRGSPLLFNGMTCKDLPKVRRSLFNPDPEETKRFLKEEFAKITRNESDRWDFDFVQGKPKNISNSRYEWTMMSPIAEAVPAQKPHQVEDASEAFYAPIESSSNNLYEEEGETVMITEDHAQSAEAVIQKKQSLITDFMQARKRLDERPLKKLESSPAPSRPLKKPRMSFANS